MKSASGTLATAQTAPVRTPYIHCVFTNMDDASTFDCSGATSRIIEISHTEGAYAGGATIILENYDRGVPDLRGYYVEIGYGDVTSGGNEYSATPRLWVRSQDFTSSPQGLISTVNLADGFTLLSEMPVLIGTEPEYYQLYNRDTTPYMILDAILSGAGFTLNTWGREPANGTNTADAGTNTTTLVDAALTSAADDFYNGWFLYNSTRNKGVAITDYAGSTRTLTHPTITGQTAGDAYIILKSDEIITSFKPYFEINADNADGVAMSYEDSNMAFYRAIMMTKSYIRASPSMVFDIVYPRSIDTADFSYSTANFYEYHQKQNEIISNSITVYCNQTTDGGWASMITGSASDTDSIARIGEIKGFFFAPTINLQEDADNRAAAIMTRIKSEALSVGLVIPHDCRMELYDYVGVTDTRGI